MAQKNAKMGHNKLKKKGVETGQKINHAIGGSVLTGYTVLNTVGEVVGKRVNLHDAIALRKELDTQD